MATQIKTYDPAAISMSVANIIVSGFEPGTFITLTRNTNNFVTTLGPDGKELIRTKRNDRSAMLTLTLRQSSDSNLSLANLAEQDEKNADGLVEIGISDATEGAGASAIEFSGTGWVEKPSDASFAETPQPRAWIFRLAEVSMRHAGIPTKEVLASIT